MNNQKLLWRLIAKNLMRKEHQQCKEKVSRKILEIQALFVQKTVGLLLLALTGRFHIFDHEYGNCMCLNNKSLHKSIPEQHPKWEIFMAINKNSSILITVSIYHNISINYLVPFSCMPCKEFCNNVTQTATA